MNFVLAMERISNFLILCVILAIVALSFSLQISLKELPCPLCLLQRIGFLFIAFGFLLNLRFGFKPSHYAVVLISGLFTSFVALRQIALHVIPGTGFYGSPVLGLHLYTWSFILSMTIVTITTLLLGFDRQYQGFLVSGFSWRFFTRLVFLITAILIMVNGISIFLQCGLNECPENPMQYEFLKKNLGQ